MGNILVVGGSGFIGQHTARRFAHEGHAVWATHSPGKTPPCVNKVNWLGVDLAGNNIAAGWPVRTDAVIFLAQARNWRRFPECAEDVFAINLGALHQTALYARRSGARCLLVSSSGTVYTDQTQPAHETDVIDLRAPRSYYAASKLAAEILLGSFSQDFPIVQLRIFTPYGPGLSPDMLFSQLVRRIQKGESIQLHGQDGLRVNPVAVVDIAEAFCRCVALDQSGTFNLGGPAVWSLREIGVTIGKVLKMAPRFETQAGTNAPVVVGDIGRLCDALKWAPHTHLEDGLRAWLSTPATESAN